MKSIIFTAMTMLLVCSCTHEIYSSKYGLCRDDGFKDLMNDFYDCHFRYPKSSEDYCHMFYKNDSLNDFAFARLQSDSSEVHIKSYTEYNVFLDSVYHSHLYGSGMLPYFSWPHMYENMANDDMKCTKKKVIIYNKEDDTRYYAYTVMHVVRKWLYGRKKWRQFDISEKQLIMKYRLIKTCVNDSMRLQLPDSVFDYPKAYSEVYNILIRHTNKNDQKQKTGKMKHYLIRYYGNGNLVSAEDKRPLPKEFVHDTQAIHFLDSCMNIDKRIKFIQFAF